MKKRLIPLLVLMVLIVTATAPSAMACQRCQGGCVLGSGGWQFCEWDGEECIVAFHCLYMPPEEPLAADFTVASVERLDIQTPQPATR